MTENDERLIEQAWAVHPMDWMDIEKLIAKADTDRARDELNSILKSKYHRDCD